MIENHHRHMIAGDNGSEFFNQIGAHLIERGQGVNLLRYKKGAAGFFLPDYGCIL